MIRPECLLADFHGAPCKRFATGTPAAGMFKATEVVVERGHLGMIRPESLFHDGQPSLIQPLRLSKLARVLVKYGQVVESCCHLGIGASKGLLRHCQCSS